ncbi:MAG: hypothetical protein ACREXU_19350 [Gammaproteobacteria bacterium]
MGRHKQTNAHLPPRMVLKHGAYYWTPRIDGQQQMVHLGREYEAALHAYYQREGVIPKKKGGSIWLLSAPE